MTAQPDEGQQHNLDGFDGPSDAARARQNSAVSPDALILDVDGFEGPLDVLLMLARSQKVDLEKISIRAWWSNIWPLSPKRGNCGLNWRRIIW